MSAQLAKITGIIISAILFLVLPGKIFAASFTLSPSDFTATSGDQFSVNLNIDTQGKSVNAADVNILYPKDILWIDSVDFSSSFGMQVSKIDNNNGRATFNFSQVSGSIPLSGQWQLATIKFSTHTGGEAQVSFVCDGTNNGSDTNIWEIGSAADIADCGQLTRASYHIRANQAASPSPSPSAGCSNMTAPSGVSASTGIADGTVQISWNQGSGVDHYSISYGLVSGGYIYGAQNIGAVPPYTISGLAIGRKYFFVLTAVNSCGNSSGFSGEVSASAGGIIPLPSPVVGIGGWQKGNTPESSSVPVSSASAFYPTPTPVSFPVGEIPPEEPEASVATEAGTILPSVSPTAFIPPKAEPVWMQPSFWLKAGILAVVLFIMVLLLSRILGSRKPVSNLTHIDTDQPKEAATDTTWPPPPPSPQPPIQDPY